MPTSRRARPNAALQRRVAVERERLGERAQRSERLRDTRRVHRGLHEHVGRCPGTFEGEGDAVADRLREPLAERRRRRPRPLLRSEDRSIRLLARLALPVGHGGEDGVAADAVGDGMVELEEQRGPVVAQPLVEPRLPERPRAVERGLVRGRDLAEELVAVVYPAQGVAAQMIVEVECRIDLPVRQRHVERRLDDSVPQARDRQDGPLDRMLQPGKVGRAVEHEQHRHGGRQHRRVCPPEGEVLARQAHRRVGGHALSWQVSATGSMGVA
jgi:hypothetical protein